MNSMETAIEAIAKLDQISAELAVLRAQMAGMIRENRIVNGPLGIRIVESRLVSPWEPEKRGK